MYSEILKALESQNISKNQFCKDVGISKAYINKVLNGKTPMSERFFMSILSLPYISDKVKATVTRTRFENKHGENYDLIMYFNEVAKEFENRLTPKRIKEIELPNESKSVSDRDILISLIYSLTKYSIKNDLVLYSNHTYAQKDIDDALYTAFYERNEALIDANFVHIIEKPYVFNKNYIDCIWSALRYGTINIKPLATAETLSSPLFPYVMVCDKYTLMWNEECDCAKFICEPILSNAIGTGFSSAAKKSSPFIIVCVDEAEIMTKETSNRFNVSVQKPIVVCSVPGSCVGEFGYNTWAEVVRKDLPKKTADFFIRTYLIYKRFQFKSMSKYYVLSDSVFEFVKTGNYAPISHRYINDFPPHLIKKIMKNWKESFKEDNGFIINSNKIFFPPFVQIDYYPSSTQIHFNSIYRKFNIYSSSIIINHGDNIGTKKFFEALLSYQTNADVLMTDAQIDYSLEKLLLLYDN